MKISARNQMKGKVTEIKEGAVNAEVIVDLGNDRSICSVITMESLKNLGIEVGSEVTTLIKASSVILMA
ncbi:TOBE domain-containing protein [Clostridium kluyveri]|uniref:Molybdenum-pterin-binding protein n=1 Tax=Clostridium kluyveri TaxID=1534 RepID=A0A1L5FBE8_CLOKL|nr:TOBE domain-containing protein [Clostridium kluyveri]APM40329.1 molybdenum-pterin-binding protein [Clostridium kluyveri]UZQ49431.1 TOBE domain-containing protein [Clostridium kluyveri]